MDRTTPGQYLRLVLLLAILAATLLYPIWLTVEGAFRGEDEAFTLHHVGVVFTDPVLRGGLLNALVIAAATTLLSALVGLPLAMLFARREFPGKTLLGALLLVPPSMQPKCCDPMVAG